MSIPIPFAQMDMPNAMWLVLSCVMPIHICEFFTYFRMDIYSAGFFPAAIQFVALAALLGAAPFVHRKALWPLFIRRGFLPVGYILVILVTNFVAILL